MLNDAMFKALFRSIEARSVVSSFLSSITGISEDLLMQADYQGGELPKKNLREKGKTSDVIIKINDGNKIVLEMNQTYNDKIFKKNTSYVFSIASETVFAGGKDYPKVILINFDNFNYYKTDKAILEFKLRDEDGHIETDQYHSIHLILENIVNLKYNKIKEVNKLVKFLKAKTIYEMEKEFEGDEKYMACVRKVEDLSTNPDFIGYYDIEEARRQEIEDIKATGFRIGREEGREEGFEEGKKNKQLEIAIEMLKEKVPIELISKCTKLSIEEIEKLNSNI